MHQTGLRVVALVCDQKTTQWALLQKMVNCSQPYFLHPVTELPVYVIIDIPHCLKNAWNALMKYDIVFENGHTSNWEHLLHLFHSDSNRQLKLAYRLTEAHFNLKLGGKMRVSLAAQVFSRTVVQAMHTLMHFRELDSSHEGTAEFCRKMNDLFDLGNTASLHDVHHKNAASSETLSEHLHDLDEGIKFIRSWKFTKKRTLKLIEQSR